MVDRYSAAMKYMKKHCSSPAATTRPVLSGVLHKSDGSLISTDTYALYIVENAHARTNDALITPDNEELDDPYPEVHRMVPNEFNFEFHFEEFQRAIKAHKVAQQVKQLGLGKVKKNEASVQLKIFPEGEMNKVIIETETPDSSFQFTAGYTERAKYEPGATEFSIHYSAELMIQGLSLLKDLGAQRIKVQIHSLLRPFVMTAADALVLIMPVRPKL